MFFEIFSPIFWASILIITLVFLFKNKDIDAIWVSTSSLALFIVSLILPDFNFLYQCLIFIGAILVQFLCIGLVIKKINKTKKIQQASDKLIGLEITALNECNEFSKSMGTIDDVIWTITCQSGYKLNKGDIGVVVAIENNVLIVKSK